YGTRGSKLALHQTRHVIGIARNTCPDIEFEEVVIKTLGDQVTGLPLFKVGGQGLFIKEIEQALLEHRIDMAVHSLKDVPHAISAGLCLVAVGCVEDARDCFLSKKYRSFSELPSGAIVGTSSLRRRSQLSVMRSDLVFSDFRGNLDTRLQKLADGEVDAIILAAAGLLRFGWADRIGHYFAIDAMTPPAGQGILAVQCRCEDVDKLRPLLQNFASRQAEVRAAAERAFLAELQGGCQTPMAVHADVTGDRLILHSFIGTPDGKQTQRRTHTGTIGQAAELGRQAAAEIIAAGGRQYISPVIPAHFSVIPAQAGISEISTDKNKIPACAGMTQKQAKENRMTSPASSAPNVFLVGAGPGDAGLITVRGLDLVKRADVIIYDQLGTAAFLSQAKPDCEMYDVGKFAGNHKVTQDDINALLAKKAAEKKLVVRLKGGDPFVFGRGGEEMQYLIERGHAVEVVPGVTSAISAPCYAGIPITQRGFTASLAVVTGHEAEKEGSDLNWQALAGIGTVVFLMGVKNLPQICQNLIAAGRAPETPVAMIQNATLPIQRTVTGTLATISEIAIKEGIQPPAVTVVGEVVALRSQLAWFEKRPLFGRRIAVTRSRLQASGLVAELQSLGAQVIECPTIKIVQHQSSDAFRSFIDRSKEFEHLVFTSVNGVTGFVEALHEQKLDLRFLGGKKIVCIGPATAAAFIDRGINPD
ncbi:MAG TPA: hydroxymethylbilane synthase, partial [Candidatus Rifleibacterium sp.]|nr:hydroxymethylbilane synthase [Candidatus Rifleibacterium sp.]